MGNDHDIDVAEFETESLHVRLDVGRDRFGDDGVDERNGVFGHDDERRHGNLLERRIARRHAVNSISQLHVGSVPWLSVSVE